MVGKAETEDIYHSATYFFYILKLLGLAPYSFDRKTLRFRMRTFNKLLLLGFILTWTSLSYMLIKSINENGFDTGAQSNILDNLLQYQYFNQHLFAGFTVVYSFLKRKHVEKFLRLILKFDLLTDQLGWKFKVIHSKYFILILFSFVSLFMITYNCVSIVVRSKTEDHYKDVNFSQVIFSMVAYVLITQFFLMISMQFIASSYCIYARLHMLIKNTK